jgi:hypothetical protein
MMRRTLLRILPMAALAASLAWVSTAFAKRSPPREVAAARWGDIELRVPHGQMGCVEAWDTQRNEMLWRRQIYVVRFQPALERDVQDVFIQSIQVDGDKLSVTNERDSAYQLDLKTLEVKVVRGRLVEGRE